MEVAYDFCEAYKREDALKEELNEWKLKRVQRNDEYNQIRLEISTLQRRRLFRQGDLVGLNEKLDVLKQRATELNRDFDLMI